MTGWWRRASPTPDAPTAAAEVMPVDFPDCVARDFPRVFDLAWDATERTLAPLDAADLTPLERRSPGLRGYDWRGYLRCSVARVVRVADVLSRIGANGRVLDLGAYFGNFTLAAAASGFGVDALDSYAAYDRAFEPWLPVLQAAGARRLDFADVGFDLGRLADASYDAVLVMGVIEHVPHSPRQLLTAVHRVLKPGGTIVLDTPNIAYLYNRQRLARGESIMAPLASQFDCDPPFEGHHREYTASEVRWMLDRTGYTDVAIDAFNYSLLGLETLQGDDLRLYREMAADPTGREVVFASARKPAG
jgi:SAM-dependent methyltransferase